MSRIKEFPKVIHVTVIEERGDAYLSASEAGFLGALGDDDEATVALYSLMSMHKVKKGSPVIKEIRSKKTK